jgi:ABC-type tungstate transport system substrate-binding protein
VSRDIRVGAVVLVGGNIDGSTQTLASPALEQVNNAHYDEAMAIAIILIGLILILAAALTTLQLRGWGGMWQRSPQ